MPLKIEHTQSQFGGGGEGEGGAVAFVEINSICFSHEVLLDKLPKKKLEIKNEFLFFFSTSFSTFLHFLNPFPPSLKSITNQLRTLEIFLHQRDRRKTNPTTNQNFNDCDHPLPHPAPIFSLVIAIAPCQSPPREDPPHHKD